MRAGTGDGNVRAYRRTRVRKFLNKIMRDERRVGRRAHCVGNVGTIFRDMIEPGQYSGERSGEALDVVGDDIQSKLREAIGIAIGVEDDSLALGLQSLDDMREDRPPSDLDQALVRPAHPPSQTACEDDPEAICHAALCNLAAFPREYVMASEDSRAKSHHGSLGLRTASTFEGYRLMLSLRHLLLAAILFVGASVSAWAAERRSFVPQEFAAAQAAGKSILVEIHAPWCPTCKAQQPILNKLEAEEKFKDLQVFRVDFDSQKEAVKSFKATTQSTLIVFKGDKERGRSVGDTSAASIAALLDKAL